MSQLSLPPTLSLFLFPSELPPPPLPFFSSQRQRAPRLSLCFRLARPSIACLTQAPVCTHGVWGVLPLPQAVIPPQPRITNGPWVRAENGLALGVGRGSQNHLEEEEVSEGVVE